MKTKLMISAVLTLLVAACGQEKSSNSEASKHTKQIESEVVDSSTTKNNPRFDIYKEVELNADLSHLSANQKQMIGLLIDASKIMDDLFWKQAYGDKKALLDSISDPDACKFADINYGPWDRLDGDINGLEAQVETLHEKYLHISSKESK